MHFWVIISWYVVHWDFLLLFGFEYVVRWSGQYAFLDLHSPQILAKIFLETIACHWAGKFWQIWHKCWKAHQNSPNHNWWVSIKVCACHRSGTERVLNAVWRSGTYGLQVRYGSIDDYIWLSYLQENPSWQVFEVKGIAGDAVNICYKAC